ncbi:phosphatidylinositol-glycan biosynthesis class X protein isoform X2 [Ricinus communis]|uniref:phosphatidylinositol-glycan biosynthesis class X protein isoform X2 n=2 Tax=Ricinus communis TaxID=3988 RepID=UPI00201AE6B3|nr:phosphatidylinositol-glycan biosynthesis class X protein isoform X2 [Ricinus communis]
MKVLNICNQTRLSSFQTRLHLSRPQRKGKRKRKFSIFDPSFSCKKLAMSVARCNSDSISNNLNIGSSSFKKYIVEHYFEKYENFVESHFQDFMADKVLHHSCKLLPDNPNDLYRLSVTNRLLIGEGSHRHLYSSIKFHFQSESISQLPNFTNCKFIILERLPSGVFADPFELQHLLQRGAFADLAVFGDTNLELPSVASNRSIVEIHMNFSTRIFFGQTNELEISIDLPLHARYPPSGESGYFEIEFGAPDLLMNCKMEGNLSNQSCLFTPNIVCIESNTGTILWRVPSGTRTHAGIVSVVTFFTAVVSTLVIVVASFLSSDINSVKTFKLS